MSALKSGMKRADVLFGILTGLLRSITTVMGELVGDVKALSAHYRSRRQQRRMLVELHRINDHALRDIGLVRDRFSGVILDDNKGDVVPTLPHPPQEDAVVPMNNVREPRDGASGFRGHERRGTDRRLRERRAENRNGQEPPRPDRRAFNRRGPICEVLDCRDLFSGRSRFLLT